MVCWEAVLSSLEDRRPGLAVLRLGVGPGGQYTCNKRDINNNNNNKSDISQSGDTRGDTDLVGGGGHPPPSVSIAPELYQQSAIWKKRPLLGKENKLKGENNLDRKIHKDPLPDV